MNANIKKYIDTANNTTRTIIRGRRKIKTTMTNDETTTMTANKQGEEEEERNERRQRGTKTRKEHMM